MIDIAFIAPSNSLNTYQSLSNKYSAIEPPTWALILAESVRSKGFNPIIIDCLAEQLDDNSAIKIIKKQKPRIICFVVYGQNVNAGTTNMSGAVRLSKRIKQKNINTRIGFLGSHVQALPKNTLETETSIDFVFLNEGIYALNNILKLKEINDKELLNISGLAVRYNNEIIFTPSEKIVPNDKMDYEMPGMHGICYHLKINR